MKEKTEKQKAYDINRRQACRQVPVPEEVRPHPIYPRYGCTEDGRLHGIRGWRKLIPHPTGCLMARISVGESRMINLRIHRFIWECFNGLIPKGMVVDHVNGDRIDNRITNLQLIPFQESLDIALERRGEWRTGRAARGFVKLTKSLAREVICAIQSGATNQQVAEQFGLNPFHVSDIRHRRHWANVWDEIESNENPT